MRFLRCLLIGLVLSIASVVARADDAPDAGEIRARFLRMADLAAAELQKPITVFHDRKDASTATHHMPSFEDAHAARALCVAYDLTGDDKYLAACRQWADRMLDFQARMIPAGADRDLESIARWLFYRGDPPVSGLIAWEVLTWGSLSYAERVAPGALFRTRQ